MGNSQPKREVFHETVLPKLCQFQAVNCRNAIVLSSKSYQMPDVAGSCSNSKFSIIRKNQPGLTLLQQIQQTYLVGSFSPTNNQMASKQIREAFLVNKIDTQFKGTLRKLRKEKIVPTYFQCGPVDYAIPLSDDKIVLANESESHYSILSGQWKERETRVQLQERYIYNIVNNFNNTLFVTYSNLKPEPSFEDLADGVCQVEAQTGSILWDYAKSRESVLHNPIRYSQNCLIVAHYNNRDFSAHLALHDTRTKDVASILDTSKVEFEQPGWFPYYQMLYNFNPCEVITAWGGVGARNTHILKLDVRCPLRKQIIIRDVPHPVFMHKCSSPGQEDSYLLVKNLYESYKYRCSQLEHITFQ